MRADPTHRGRSPGAGGGTPDQGAGSAASGTAPPAQSSASKPAAQNRRSSPNPAATARRSGSRDGCSAALRHVPPPKVGDRRAVARGEGRGYDSGGISRTRALPGVLAQLRRSADDLLQLRRCRRDQVRSSRASSLGAWHCQGVEWSHGVRRSGRIGPCQAQLQPREAGTRQCRAATWHLRWPSRSGRASTEAQSGDGCAPGRCPQRDRWSNERRVDGLGVGGCRRSDDRGSVSGGWSNSGDGRTATGPALASRQTAVGVRRRGPRRRRPPADADLPRRRRGAARQPVAVVDRPRGRERRACLR